LKSFLSFAALLATFLTTTGAVGGGVSRIMGHVPLKQMSRAQELGRKNASSQVQLAIVLNPSDPDGLASTLHSLYDPNDPLYHHFLTPQQFAERFAPSDQELNRVSQYLNARGIHVTSTHSNHLVIDAEGASSDIENAFQIELHDYLSDDGRIVYAPTSDPSVADEIASSLNAVVGLSNFSLRKSHAHPMAAQPRTLNINNYMTPARTRSVYGLNTLSQTGSGETLALFELDGYTSSDITQYENNFSLPAVPLNNILVNGATGFPSSGADSGAVEVTLDIELAIGMAPGLSKILVYEAPNTETGLIDAYSRIASDNLAQEVSTSWGQAENEMSSSDFTSENTIFVEMASQGQSLFAAAGDSGAYDDSVDDVNTTLEVDDPASQPYVTGVGGTTLSWTGNAWSSETSWRTSGASGTYGQTNYDPTEGGGGGISTQWSQPAWQSGLSTVPNKGSSSMRMVPDVSLDADPTTGYPVYYAGAWTVFGGTSCAAPLWASFTALVNQQRVAGGQSRLGFANPTIYAIGNASSSTNFHDIADGSTNLYYPATTGYDLTTGWGSINGTTLFNSLVAEVLAPVAPGTLTLFPGALSIAVSWPASTDASTYTVLRSTSPSGPFSSIASGLTLLSYNDTAVSYGTTYYYEVEAVDGAGTSPTSAIKSTAPYPAPPGAPSDLIGSAIE
jgi:subtilase family serine protease